MHNATLRESGGSVIVTVPKVLLELLGWGASSKIGMTVRDHALVLEQPRYTLEQLLADFDPDAYRSDVEAWDRAPAVGREVF